MKLRREQPQKSQTELARSPAGEASEAARSVAKQRANHEPERSGTRELMEAVVQRDNLLAALKRVKTNDGAPGIDGMTCDELPAFLRANWPSIRERLLSGKYKPTAVRRHTISKPDGGERKLGIPTVLDRFVQQAIAQVLSPLFEPTFSPFSYGFRPGRSAIDAIDQAQRYVDEGRVYVVDVDIEAFFDNVNHDVLMARLAKRIEDKRLLLLIRRFLQAGMMDNGVRVRSKRGTPQGGPLSPLLANVLLDEVDKELESRGHAFVRYADDCNVYLRSMRAAERVMELMERLITKLHLRINANKSAVDHVRNRKLLGFTFWIGRGRKSKVRIAPKSLSRFKKRVRELTRRRRGQSVQQVVDELTPYVRGWRTYFKRAEVLGTFPALDRWIHTRLRTLQAKHWRSASPIYKGLAKLGIPTFFAMLCAKEAGRWHHLGSSVSFRTAMPQRHFVNMGLPVLAK
jgi:RNA-directed DNA polymerase